MKEWELRDYRRQKAIEQAVEAADRIILGNSDGSTEETEYITAQVALKFVEKVAGRDMHRMLIRDLGLDKLK